ncbi:beta-lactamase class A [Geodermatophilus pulveris]|uniref:Beta-lactamase class A n=1 Tax=Geodermatophilus pulveris TaxID=1564159 RepID=A0A239BT43_9ACTN|nr:serine hydrolase [Geodermatophilus pulveris]SNS10611.1 beta-lactamase class A [Geodermatophilus pulveris]
MTGTDDVAARIADLATDFTGQLAVSAVDLTTGERVEWQPDLLLPTASVIKESILIALLRAAEAGTVDLADRVTLEASERVGGSGVLKLFEGGLQPTVRDVATLMIAVSDNTATNMVLDLIGGPEPVNRAMAELGLDSIRLHNAVDFELIGNDVRRLGEATVRDLCELGRLIATRKAFGEMVSATAEEVLATQQYLDQAMRYTLANPYARELGLMAPLSVASKTGSFTGTRVDAGIVRFAAGGGFCYAVANHEASDISFLPEAEGAVLNGLVGRALVEHWWPADAGPAPVVPTAYEA